MPGQLCEWLERHDPASQSRHNHCWPLPGQGPGQKVKSGVSSPPAHQRWEYTTGLGGPCEQMNDVEALTDLLGRLDQSSGP